MSPNGNELSRRKDVALAAIKKAFSADVDDYGPSLFVSHHLDEIEEEYWGKHLGTRHPQPRRVLDILELRSHWSEHEDDGLDILDFTLPERVTNYVISVSFDETGRVETMSMES